MKIVNVIGGLGNQMFQYAFALGLQQMHPDEDVYIDTYAFRGYNLHNGYELNKLFKLSLPKARKWDIIKLYYPTFTYKLWQIAVHIMPKRKTCFKERLGGVFEPTALEQSQSLYYEGYWQDERYFKHCINQIRKEFEFPQFVDKRNIDLGKEIQSKNSVSVHIRRGDYLKDNEFGGITTVNYYKRAISELKKHTTPELYVIFSNDIDWCKSELSECFENTSVVFVDWNTGANSFRDMQLMTMCKHNIIANSSFSWWGAWLNNNEGKIIIGPERWKNVDYQLEVIPESWIKINVD